MSRHRSPDESVRLAPWIHRLIGGGAIVGILVPPITALAQANAPDATAVADTAAATTATRATFTSLRVPELRVSTPAATPTAKVEHVEAVPVPVESEMPIAPARTYLGAPEPTETQTWADPVPSQSISTPPLATTSAPLTSANAPTSSPTSNSPTLTPAGATAAATSTPSPTTTTSQQTIETTEVNVTTPAETETTEP